MADVLNFASREEASSAAAAFMVERLQASLEQSVAAAFVVAGGSTPQRCFEFLSEAELDWANVTAMLSDERWVPADHEASNEGMVREYLCRNAASDATLLPIYQSDMTVDERCDSLQSALDGTRFSVSLIGIGSDGHFASLFPDADRLAAGLNPDTQHFYIPIKTDASPYDRVSMTLAALLRSDAIAVLCFGEEKRQVVESALSDSAAYPISHLLHQGIVPVRVYWAP